VYYCSAVGTSVKCLLLELLDPVREAVSSVVFAFDDKRCEIISTTASSHVSSRFFANSVNVSTVIRPSNASSINSETAFSEIIQDDSLITVALSPLW
jgi:hypothetical protein